MNSVLQLSRGNKFFFARVILGVAILFGAPIGIAQISLAQTPAVNTSAPAPATAPNTPNKDEPPAVTGGLGSVRLVLQLGHSARLTGMAFSGNAQWVLTGSADHTARLWDTATGREIRTFVGHTGAVTGVALSPSGKVAATGSEDDSVRLWDTATGKPLRVLNGHEDDVMCVAFAPDGRTLLSGGADNTARLWNVSTGEELRRLSDHRNAVVRVAFNGDGLYFVTGSNDGQTRVWDAATGQLGVETRGWTSGWNAPAFLDEGSLLVVARGNASAVIWDGGGGKNGKITRAVGGDLACKWVVSCPAMRTILTAHFDGSARLWDANLRQLARFDAPGDVNEEAPVVAVSDDGKLACTGYANGVAYLWDTATGRKTRRLSGQVALSAPAAFAAGDALFANGSPELALRLWDIVTNAGASRASLDSSPFALAFAPNNKAIFTIGSDHVARLWPLKGTSDLESDRILPWPAKSDDKSQLQGHRGALWRVAFSPDGKKVLTGAEDGTALLWDTNTGEVLRRFVGHEGAVTAVAYSPDGLTIATGGVDKTARLWDVRGGDELVRCVGHSGRVWSVAFSPDSKQVLTGAGDGTARLWNALDARELQRFPGHTAAVYSIAFSRDGKKIFTGSGDGVLRVWNATSAGKTANSGEALRLIGHKGAIWAVRPFDANNVVTAGADGSARLWNTAAARETRSFGNSGALWDVAVAPDGRTLLTSGADGTVRLWDAGDGHEVRRVGEVGGTGWRSAAFSPDGRLWLGGGLDKTARLWDGSTGKQLRCLGEGDNSPGHSAPVTDMALSGDGRTLLTAGMDGSARLWNCATNVEMQRFIGHGAPVMGVANSPDGKQILTGDQNGTLRLWDVQSGREMIRWAGGRGLRTVAWSADGRWIFQGGDDGGHLFEAPKPETFKQTGAQPAKATVPVNEVARLPLTAAFTLCAAFSPDSRWLLTGERGGQAKIWDVTTLAAAGLRGPVEPKTRLREHRQAVTCVAWSRDGQSIVTGSLDKTVRLWNAANYRRMAMVEGNGETYPVAGVALSADGRQILIANRSVVRLLETATGRELRRFDAAGRAVRAVAFLPDGTSFVAAHEDAAARGWDMASGAVTHRFAAAAYATNDGVSVGEAALTSLQRAAFSADGQLALAADGAEAQIWNVGSSAAQQRFKGHLEEVTCVALSGNGQLALTGSADNTARLWRVADGQTLQVLRGHAGALTSVAFSPDEKFLLSTARDGTARLWDAATGKQTRILPSTGGPVWCAAFSPDSTRVLMGDSFTATLWNSATGTQERRLEGPGGSVRAVRFSRDGKYCLTASDDGACNLWNMRSVAVDEAELCTLVGFTGGDWAAVDTTGRYDVEFSEALRNASLVEEIAPEGIAPPPVGALPVGALPVGAPVSLPGAASSRDLWSSEGETRGLHWVLGKAVVELDQLKSEYYEPGLLDKKLGRTSSRLHVVPTRLPNEVPPQVELTPPLPGDDILTIRLKNEGGGFGKVRVWINNQEYEKDARAGAGALNSNAATWTRRLPLVGKSVRPGDVNSVRVVASTERGYADSRPVEAKWTASGTRHVTKPRFFAVVVGVSKYGNDARITPLRFAASDAQSIAKALLVATRTRFGGEQHITLLTGAIKTGPDTVPGVRQLEANKANLKKTFEEIAAQANANDVFVVYLAGHGVAVKRNVRDSGTYYFLTQDARNAEIGEALYQEWAVSNNELSDWISQVAALQQVLILDTCAAGALTGGTVAAPNGARTVQDGEQVLAWERVQDRSGSYVLMGSAANAFSYESERYKGGLLTHALLEGMRGAALSEGKYLEVGRWFYGAKARVRELAASNGDVQEPIVLAPGGETPFYLGALGEEEQRAIPIAVEDVQLLAPELYEKPSGAPDPLRFEQPLGDALAALARESGDFAFVPSGEAAGAIRLTGSYTTEDKKIRLRLKLVSKNNSQASTVLTFDETDDLVALARQAAERIRQAVLKMSGPPAKP